VTDRIRAEAMRRRIVRTASRLGVDEGGVELLRRAFELGMAPRFARDLDDHHPDYLHPSRTALILMDDARVSDAPVLAAALVMETRDPSLRAEASALRGLGAVAALAEAVPVPKDIGLVEALLSASLDARMVAIAERLDHARHLHLRPREEWPAYHALTRDTYAPIAERTHPVLAGRITWWCTTFATRFLGS
jgi:(p)ppGpp synthase/HD superfamily hydrolase